MYEHIVPVSPFEENKEGTTIYESINAEKKETGNRNNHPEELQKSIITTTTITSINVDTINKGENNNNDNYTKGINVTQNKSRGFRSFRL
jgi:hypothetical protein